MSAIHDLWFLLEQEEIAPFQLKDLEKFLDRLYAAIGIDIDFMKQHFLERINDARNGKPISLAELKDLFLKIFNNYSRTISKKGEGFQAVLTDLSTDLNVPFVLNYDQRNKEMDLIAKTIMRKKGFLTNTPKFSVQ